MTIPDQPVIQTGNIIVQIFFRGREPSIFGTFFMPGVPPQRQEKMLKQVVTAS